MATKRHKPEEIVTKLRQIDGSGGTRRTLKFIEVHSAFCRSELFGHVLDARLATNQQQWTSERVNGSRPA